MRSEKPMHLCRKSLFWSKCINKYRIGFCNLRINITYHYLSSMEYGGSIADLSQPVRSDNNFKTFFIIKSCYR